MGFRPTVSPQLTEMDPAIFRPEALQLRHRAPTPLDQRLSYDETQNTLSCNFEGLALTTAEDAKSLAAHLEETFRSIGRRVKVVVNYDNFEINAEAIPTFFEMIARNEEHVLSRTRYSTNAYYRRRLGHQFTAASLQHRLYGNYADALTGVQLE